MGKRVDGPTRRSFLKRTGVAASAAVTGLTGAASATGKPTDRGNRGDTGKNRRLSLNVDGEVETLDPVRQFDAAPGQIIEQLHDGLFDYPDGETTSVGGLAAEYAVDETFTTYTITLERNARFHDDRFGTVTAQDVVYTFERIRTSPRSRIANYFLGYLDLEQETDADGEYVPGTLGVDALDERTVEFSLESPFHSTLELLSHSMFSILPEGIVGDVPGYDGIVDYETFSREEPVGAGPFQLRAWTGSDLHLDRFPRYHGDTATIDGIDYSHVADEAAGYERALAEQVDVFGIPDAEYDPGLATPERTDEKGREFGRYGPLPNGREVDYVSATSLTTFYLGFVVPNVPRPVRRAFALALDQDRVARDRFDGRSRPAYNFVPPNVYPGGTDGYSDHATEYPYGTDARVAAAREVMEAAGYDESNRYEVRYTTYESDSWEQMGETLASRLADAHIDVTVERIGFGALLSRGRQNDLDAFTLGWHADWAGADNFLQLLYPQNHRRNIGLFDWGDTPAAERASEAWETIQANPGSSPAAVEAREQAAVTMEEANWTDAVAIPVVHNDVQRFWYDWVDVPAFGALGPSRQKLNDVRLRPPQSANGNRP
ncbi:ABC transporter substrate-binding protein [Haloarchaeobius sp. HRN-SO-5]|uniref:ABC transporter substrate-binding protein n=1 Tax=Haloarchaeobius sp. HRN-SO-5 TaxID=3446118 RepID=UPI003EBF5EA8